MYQSTNVSTYQYTKVPMYQCTNILIYNNTNIPIYQYTNIPIIINHLLSVFKNKVIYKLKEENYRLQQIKCNEFFASRQSILTT